MKFHIAIKVKDLSESQSFYKKLGFEKVDEWGRDERKAFVLGKDDFAIEIVSNKKEDDNSIKLDNLVPVPHIGIEVDNLEKTLDSLTRFNIEIGNIKEGKTVKRLVFIKDPNGFPIELYEKL